MPYHSRSDQIPVTATQLRHGRRAFVPMRQRDEGMYRKSAWKLSTGGTANVWVIFLCAECDEMEQIANMTDSIPLVSLRSTQGVMTTCLQGEKV